MNPNFNVIKGPVALSYLSCNGHRYWMGYASGNRCTGISRKSAEIALEDAKKVERNKI